MTRCRPRTRRDGARCWHESIDTADVYGLDYNGSGFGGNEELLGKVLAQAPACATARCSPPRRHHAADPVRLERRLPPLGGRGQPWRLGVEVIDLYQIHRPDMFAHPAQVAETLSSLVGEGKIRAVGVSNHTPAQHDALIAHLGDLPLATSQPEYSPPSSARCAMALSISACVMASCRSPGARWWRSSMSGENVPAALIATLDELAEREESTERDLLRLRARAPVGTGRLARYANPDRLRAAVAALDVTDRNDVYRIVQDSEGVPLP